MPRSSNGFSSGKLMPTRKARPERFRISLRQESGGIPLALPSQRLWPAGIIMAATFLIFAGIAWSQAASIRSHNITSVFDLSVFLFQGFWILGWSVGVVVVGALAALLLFYKESARLRDGRLIHTPRLGPLQISLEYDLTKIRNLRLESATGDTVRIRFDYGAGNSGLGSAMPRPEAEKLIMLIRNAVSFLPRAVTGETSAPIDESVESVTAAPRRFPAPEAPAVGLTSSSSLALIVVNLLPLGGVLSFDWNLADVMVLYWAESAVIGFWNVIKLAIVGKWMALLIIPFFVGHFGGFMAGHFLFIYYFFVREIGATGAEPGVWNALVDLFVPLRSALLSLCISHGISFFSNFLGRREYLETGLKRQMTVPYKRIMIMHVTLLVGGFLTLLLRTPQPALLLLIILKTGADLHAHLREHGEERSSRRSA
jgi:hypothetical protein